MFIGVKRTLGFALRSHAPGLSVVQSNAKYPFGPTFRLLQTKGCQLSYIGYTAIHAELNQNQQQRYKDRIQCSVNYHES